MRFVGLAGFAILIARKGLISMASVDPLLAGDSAILEKDPEDKKSSATSKPVGESSLDLKLMRFARFFPFLLNQSTMSGMDLGFTPVT